MPISIQHKSYFGGITDFLLHAEDNINAILEDEHVKTQTCKALCILKPHCTS
jgi:hypothetical protein